MIEIRPLEPDEQERVDAELPLNRLDRPRSEYLVAWEDGVPLGHVCVEWAEPPELQDLWVLPERRRGGIGAALVGALEARVAARGLAVLALTVGIGNHSARRLYERLGYERTAVPPQRVKGTILLRGEPFEVDDTLLGFAKPL